MRTARSETVVELGRVGGVTSPADCDLQLLSQRFPQKWQEQAGISSFERIDSTQCITMEM